LFLCFISSCVSVSSVFKHSYLTLWSRSSSKCYLRTQSVPQREHHTSPLQRLNG
jgi:hypothetical protein